MNIHNTPPPPPPINVLATALYLYVHVPGRQISIEINQPNFKRNSLGRTCIFINILPSRKGRVSALG